MSQDAERHIIDTVRNVTSEARHSLALVALGGNLPSILGPPAATLRAALAELGGRGTRISAVSRFYATECFPQGAGPDFVNAAALCDTMLAPDAFLARLHEIEQMLGRTRGERWSGRSIDLDLIAMGETVLPDAATFRHWHDLADDIQRSAAPDRLILPHPRLQDRAFVLIPLADVAPDWRHPVLGRTVAELAGALNPGVRATVRPL